MLGKNAICFENSLIRVVWKRLFIIGTPSSSTSQTIVFTNIFLAIVSWVWWVDETREIKIPNRKNHLRWNGCKRLTQTLTNCWTHEWVLLRSWLWIAMCVAQTSTDWIPLINDFYIYFSYFYFIFLIVFHF